MGAFRVLVWVIVGAAVGRLATMLVRRGPLGMVGSMVVGALGAVAAGGAAAGAGREPRGGPAWCRAGGGAGRGAGAGDYPAGSIMTHPAPRPALRTAPPGTAAGQQDARHVRFIRCGESP
ncbi:hypothetical protein Rmf_08500 [Roseomonas fluvialis]|uniref:Uncharacterized protein n=1 Tax=Roseomonas fluvialis TaxID=1750527 RepID=A0ABM7XZI7_9PROT|nr:hypothetical protein Rmf_08500 [Roseomonas fluvialis]